MIKLANPVHPGEILAEEFLGPSILDIASFSGEAGIDVGAVVALIEGRTGITDTLAAKLAAYWGTSAEFWLNLQKNYEKSAQQQRDNDMHDAMTIELSETAFAELVALAKKNGLNVEEQAKRIIQEHFEVKDPHQRSQVSLEFLRQDVEAVLSAAERGPVHIVADGGHVFVIIVQEEFERLTDTES
jgi:addiction module HigA family antidote